MKIRLYIGLSIIILSLVSCRKKRPVFDIPQGYVGMFGYGSLMSKKFIEGGILGANYTGPYLAAHLNGFQRSWTFAWPSSLPFPAEDDLYYKDFILVEGDSIYPENFVYLNIKPVEGAAINGVLYSVPEQDLAKYDEWELGYERVEVTDLIADYAFQGGSVFAYKAPPDFTIETNGDLHQNIIERSYYQIIEEAFEYWGTDFEKEYKQSTVSFDTSIIQDNKKEVWINPPLDTLKKLRAVFRNINSEKSSPHE